MNEIKVKVEVEKKLVIPKMDRIDETFDTLCVIEDNAIVTYCNGISCNDCICNINNLKMLANSQNLQLL